MRSAAASRLHGSRPGLLLAAEVDLYNGLVLIGHDLQQNDLRARRHVPVLACLTVEFHLGHLRDEILAILVAARWVFDESKRRILYETGKLSGLGQGRGYRGEQAHGSD